MMKKQLLGLLSVLCMLAACAPPPVIVTTAPPAAPMMATATVPGIIGTRPTSVAELPLTPAASNVTPPAENAVVASTAAREYTVQAGDTLLGLAIAFSVPMAAIQLQNDLGAVVTVKVGETLAIPANAGWEGASPFWVLHVVAEGEVLGTIAMAYGVDVAQLQAVNGLTDVDLISLGQLLVLPLAAPSDAVWEQNRPPATLRPPATTTPIPPIPPTATPTQPLALTVTPASAPLPPEPTVTPVSVSPPVAPSVDDMGTLAVDVFAHLNAQRAAHGLLPLAWNATLANAAQLHAEDCYARGWCGHTGSDGSTMKERIRRAGYDPGRWSECWAWYGSVAGAVAAWMDEIPPNDPHRRTILSEWLTEVGVGVMPGNGHGYYFIADFGTPWE